MAEFDEKRLRQESRQLEIDRLYFNAHQTELYEQYHGMYVAIYREELVAVAATGKELSEQLMAKSIRPDTSYWQFLPVKRTILAPANRMRLID